MNINDAEIAPEGPDNSPPVPLAGMGQNDSGVP
jgi:hypothetical protein